VREFLRGLARERRRLFVVLLGLAAAGLVGFGIFYWPELDYRAARAALREHDDAAARAALVRYLEAHPRHAEAHLLMARLDRRAGDYVNASRHLEACQYFGGSAEAVQLERALALVQKGSPDQRLAALCAEHLARADEDEYYILEALSQGLTKQYRLDDALTHLNRMLTLQPDCAYALRGRAWIYSQKQQYDAAEADYRRVLELDPDDTGSHLGLAHILLDVRHANREAADQYERLWAIRKDATVARGLARSWRNSGRQDEARRLLDEWLKANPADVVALTERGLLALDDGATQQAVALLRQAAARAPYLIEAHYGLYLGLTRLGKKAEAVACQARLDEAKQQSKKDREALAVLSGQMRKAPDDADLRCQFAEIMLRQGDEEGLRWLHFNLRQHPDHRPSHLALADYYDRNGQTNLAAEHRRQAGQASKSSLKPTAAAGREPRR
jgi:tetratricopeptide (TPR) repeat protein